MKRSATAGFTMLEVLISIVVIAFGLLGVAGLQAFAVKNNQSAGTRITATTLAMDLVDRVHSNPPALTLPSGYNKPNISDYSTFNAACTTGTGCSPLMLAQNDLSEWSTLVAAALPSGRGIVCIDSTPNDGVDANAPACDGTSSDGNGIDNYVVKIWWRDDRTVTGVPAAPQRFAWNFIP